MMTQTMTKRPESDRNALMMTDNECAAETRFWTPALIMIVLLYAGCQSAALHFPRCVAWPLHDPSARVARVRTGIDPNAARWSELAQLPGIGETLARHIVALREQRRTVHDDVPSVFKRPIDLARVKGIGDKKVHRMQRFLRFRDGDD